MTKLLLTIVLCILPCVTFAEDYSSDRMADTVNKAVRQKCQWDWPDDFKMQAYCVKQQLIAVLVLLAGKPQDIKQEQFLVIRKKCAVEWLDDFQMRAYCERMQFDGVRELDAGR